MTYAVRREPKKLFAPHCVPSDDEYGSWRVAYFYGNAKADRKEEFYNVPQQCE